MIFNDVNFASSNFVPFRKTIGIKNKPIIEIPENENIEGMDYVSVDGFRDIEFDDIDRDDADDENILKITKTNKINNNKIYYK